MDNYIPTREEYFGGEDGTLPANVSEAIREAEVLILIGSANMGTALSVKQVYASGTPNPDMIASHAYAEAARQAHGDLLRQAMGEPTNAQRYIAFREFATMVEVDEGRFETINTMLLKFETDNLDENDKGKPDYMDRVADFLVHALRETTPLVVEQRPLAN